MNTLDWALRGAGALLLLIAAANAPAAGILRYRANLARVDGIVRQIFWVHVTYTILSLLAVAGACLIWPASLRGYPSACLALFAGLRLWIQLRVYDPDLRRAHRAGDIFFSFAYVYMTVAFGAAAL